MVSLFVSTYFSYPNQVHISHIPIKLLIQYTNIPVLIFSHIEIFRKNF